MSSHAEQRISKNQSENIVLVVIEDDIVSGQISLDLLFSDIPGLILLQKRVELVNWYSVKLESIFEHTGLVEDVDYESGLGCTTPHPLF